MTMVSSGPISLAGNATTGGLNQSINIELGQSATATISLNDANVRTLLAKTGAGTTISLNDAYGKSNRAALSVTYSSNTANASVNVASLSGYVAGISDVTITINSGVYVYSTSTGNAGLTLTGGTTGDTITIVNNGFIMGQGGRGGQPGSGNGTAGGAAISLGFNTTINNTNGSAYIGGGGGGGGYRYENGGGGGAGGGAGGTFFGGTGGAGGGPGSSGSNGAVSSSIDPTYGTTSYQTGGGGGGRIFPGTGGAGGNGTSAGSSWANSYGRGGSAGGGGAAGNGGFGVSNTTGGAGGSANGAGGNATGNGGSGGVSSSNGGGGGWGASGGSSSSVAGSGGGRAVQLNGRTVTWVSGDTTRVYGAVS